MSTLKWITEKELERDKNKGDLFRGKKNIRILKKRGNASGHQGENERQWKKSQQEHIKRVTRKFLEVSRCSRAKQQQRNVQKKDAARAKLVILAN